MVRRLAFMAPVASPASVIHTKLLGRTPGDPVVLPRAPGYLTMSTPREVCVGARRQVDRSLFSPAMANQSEGSPQ